MKRYANLVAALDALERDCIVDEVENQLSTATLNALKRRALMDRFSWCEHFPHEMVKPRLCYRDEGGRLIAWFAKESSP